MPPKHKKLGRPMGSKNKSNTLRNLKKRRSATISSALKEIKHKIKKTIKVENGDEDNYDYSFSKNAYNDPDDPNLSIRSIEKNKVCYLPYPLKYISVSVFSQ